MSTHTGGVDHGPSTDIRVRCAVCSKWEVASRRITEYQKRSDNFVPLFWSGDVIALLCWKNWVSAWTTRDRAIDI
jgi:hypothetical protein